MARKKLTVVTGGRDGCGNDSSGSGSGPPNADDWRDKLTRNTRGFVEASAHNIMLILLRDQKLDGLFRLDELANAVTLTRDPPWRGANLDEFTDVDGTELSAWLGDPDRYRVNASHNLIMDSVEAVARRAPYHPVRGYLGGLKWDGEARLETMFSRLFGAPNTNYTRSIAKCVMVSAVARAMWVDPIVRYNGAQVDFMLVMTGCQGGGKTSAVRILFGPQFYTELTEPPTNKDFYQNMRGRWGIEISEMDSFSKAENSRVKQIVTARFDTYRPSYGRVARSYKRECVFMGTCNEGQFLRDPTGARRFLPLRAAKVDKPALARERDQLWAEAVTLFRGGFEWWNLPPEAKLEQEEATQTDSWEDTVRTWLDGRFDAKYYPSRILGAGSGKPLHHVTTSEVLRYAINMEEARHGRIEQMRIAGIMHRLGRFSRQKTFDGTRSHWWIVQCEEEDDEPPF